MPIGVSVAEGVVVGIGVFVQGAGVGDVSIGQRAGLQRVVGTEGLYRAAGKFIGLEEPSEVGGVVAGAE